MGHVGGPADPGEGRVRHRVEVDAPLVGLLGVGPSAVPGVELHGAHLHRPGHVGEPGDAQLVGVQAVAGEVQPHGLDPRGRSPRKSLLVHLLARHPVGEAVQHARSLAQRVEDAVTDRQVVPHQVELGLAARGEVDPLRARDAHVEAVDVEHHRLPELTLARRHARHRMPVAHLPGQRAATGCGTPVAARSVPRATGSVGRRVAVAAEASLAAGRVVRGPPCAACAPCRRFVPDRPAAGPGRARKIGRAPVHPRRCRRRK